MKNNISTNEEFEIKQLNPKVRLFLFITINWLVTSLIFTFPIGMVLSISQFVNHKNPLGLIITISFFVVITSTYWFGTAHTGIQYFPKKFNSYYLKKNHQRLQKMKNLEVSNVTNLFDVIPICAEGYKKDIDLEDRNFGEFRGLSRTEYSSNRLIVNGKINHCAFSWGVITELKKNNFKIFLLAILYLGPILGLFFGFFPQLYANSIYGRNWSRGSGLNIDWNKKLGGVDLFPTNVGKPNSENYLIFAAKLQNRFPAITLIPKNGDVNQAINIKNQYNWPSRISDQQKEELQALIQTLDFLPSIYVYRNNISIVMKKYHYNRTDDAQLQTWELLKQEDSDSDVQFKYLDNAIKIYNIFNQKEL